LKIKSFNSRAQKTSKVSKMAGKRLAGDGLAALAALAVSFALSVVSNLVVEQPRIRLGKISAALMVRSALADAARCPN
jgi:peptidoglycan/LPS O-acetylase OafA/YrhL